MKTPLEHMLDLSVSLTDGSDLVDDEEMCADALSIISARDNEMVSEGERRAMERVREAIYPRWKVYVDAEYELSEGEYGALGALERLCRTLGIDLEDKS